MDRRKKSINAKSKITTKKYEKQRNYDQTAFMDEVIAEYRTMLRSFWPPPDHPWYSWPHILLRDYNENSTAINRDDLVLKYPNNVIVVQSPDGSSPPPKRGEIRFGNICAASQYAAAQADKGAAKQWSIVVHPGFFVNDCQLSSPKANSQVSCLPFFSIL